jgi:hypothetical protein
MHSPTGYAAEMHSTATEAAAAEVHPTAAEAATAEMHSATTEATVHTTESTTAAECHSWRRNDDRGAQRGRREATDEFALHDSDPP